MLSAKSESDITSLAPSSPSRSPKRPVYYVQSPSRDSHDGDKSSSMQATPISNSPMESPSHPSFGRHSRNSSASRFSGIFRSSSGRKGSRKRNDKGWPECGVILEEGSYREFEDMSFARRFQALIAVFTFLVVFTVFCLIIWGASRPFKAEVTVKSLAVHNLYVWEGTDHTGVPTKILTINSTLHMNIYNPATFFGIHVHTSPINLVYSDISIATGETILKIPGFTDNVVTHLLSGLGAGFFAVCIGSPVDVVKSRMMGDSSYKSTIDCFVKTLKNDGPLAFYKGFIPNFGRLGSWNVIMFLTLEQQTSPAITHHHFHTTLPTRSPPPTNLEGRDGRHSSESSHRLEDH